MNVACCVSPTTLTQLSLTKTRLFSPTAVLYDCLRCQQQTAKALCFRVARPSVVQPSHFTWRDIPVLSGRRDKFHWTPFTEYRDIASREMGRLDNGRTDGRPENTMPSPSDVGSGGNHIFIMWVVIAEKVLKVRGQGRCTKCVTDITAEAYISTMWWCGSLVVFRCVIMPVRAAVQGSLLSWVLQQQW